MGRWEETGKMERWKEVVNNKKTKPGQSGSDKSKSKMKRPQDEKEDCKGSKMPWTNGFMARLLKLG